MATIPPEQMILLIAADGRLSVPKRLLDAYPPGTWDLRYDPNANVYFVILDRHSLASVQALFSAKA